MSDQDKDTMVGNKIVHLLSTIYGPYAFGVSSLLIIWYTIVAPHMERQAIDYSRNEKVVDSLQGVVSSIEAAARTLERTAIVLETVVERAEEPK